MTIIARGQITVATVEDGSDGQDGQDGATGPSVVYRGDFSSTTVYYNNALRRDVVRHNLGYYIFSGADASSGVWNAAAWADFGDEFDSIATRLLLAENAEIGGFIFHGGKLISQLGTINGAESSDYSHADFVPYITLDGTTGSSIIQQGEFYGGIGTLFYPVDENNCTPLGNNCFKVSGKLNLQGSGFSYQKQNIVLPNDTSFIGKQVNIHNGTYVLTRTGLMYENATVVRAEEGYIYYRPFIGAQTELTAGLQINSVEQIEYLAGTLSFLCVPGQGGTPDAVVRWICLNYPSEDNSSGSGGGSGSGSGDVTASGTLTSNVIIVGGGNKVVKSSGYRIETALSGATHNLPTSEAVKGYVDSAVGGCGTGNVSTESMNLSKGMFVIGDGGKTIASSSIGLEQSLSGYGNQVPSSLAVKSYVDNFSEGAEWYNIYTKRILGRYCTVIENYDTAIANNADYRIVLLKYRHQHAAGRKWSMPMFPYEQFGQGVIGVMPPNAISEQNAWWNIGGRQTAWFARTSAAPNGIVSLAATFRGGHWMWKNTRNKKMPLGVAIYKHTGSGTIGWQRISNIAFIEFFKTDTDNATYHITSRV